MKTKHIRIDKRNCLKVKSIEEERLKLYHHPFDVLKTSFILQTIIN
jgi:hypothetical protein